MGFSLKKALGGVAAPLSGIGGFTKGLLFGSKGPKNPYGAVDFASLFAQDLEAPGKGYDYGGAYKDLMTMINAPSSVESVLGDVEGQDMQNLLDDVDIETKGAYGSTMADMADRGLVGEGQSSDIALNALAQVQGMGARTKSGIHSQYALGRLNRLMDKERRAEGAQSGWLNLLAGMAESARGRNLQRMLGLSGAQAGAYGNAANLSNTKTPGLLEEFLRKGAGEAGTNVGAGLVAMCFHPDTMIKMADGGEKRIGDVVLGDVTAGGKTVSVRRAYASDMCRLGNTFVTSKHCVLHDGEWKRVGDVPGVEQIDGTHEVVSLIVENHTIESAGMLFDDEEETVDVYVPFPTKQAHLDYLNQHKRG